MIHRHNFAPHPETTEGAPMANVDEAYAAL